jgi:hypothetical protein
MKNFVLVASAAFLLPIAWIHADEMDHVISARVDAMREARTSTLHYQPGMGKNGSPDGSSTSRPTNLAKPTVGTAVEPNVIHKVLLEPVVSAQRDTTKQAADNVLVVQQQLKTAVEPTSKTALIKQLQINLAALNIQKENLRKTLIAETRLEISKAAKARRH